VATPTFGSIVKSAIISFMNIRVFIKNRCLCFDKDTKNNIRF
jgi:hypothetical protein